MVQAAHARGLLVIDDIVVNHAGDLVTGSGRATKFQLSDRLYAQLRQQSNKPIRRRSI